METNDTDRKVGIQLAGDPRVIYARVRERTTTEATLFVRLRMITLGSECYLQNKKGIARPVIFEEVYSLTADDGHVWVHLKMKFKHAYTNDVPEDTDAPVQLTVSGQEPIKCLVNVSAPRYMMVRSSTFANFRKSAEGVLEEQLGADTRRVMVEEVNIQKDTSDIPELVVRVRYLDTAKPTDQAQGYVQRDFADPLPDQPPMSSLR